MEHTKNWPQDIADMHSKFGVHPVVENMTREQLLSYIDFRLKMCQEELNEAVHAFEERNADGTVDALIDLCVFAIGTLNVLKVDEHEAWARVHRANMKKEPGVKKERPNPFGFPDLIKPEGWEGPVHHDNVGLLEKAYGDD